MIPSTSIADPSRSPSRKRKLETENAVAQQDEPKRNNYGLSFYLITLPCGSIYVAYRCGIAALKELKQSIIDAGKETVSLSSDTISESVKAFRISKEIAKSMFASLALIIQKNLKESVTYTISGSNEGFKLIKSGTNPIGEAGFLADRFTKNIIFETADGFSSAGRSAANGIETGFRSGLQLAYYPAKQSARIIREGFSYLQIHEALSVLQVTATTVYCAKSVLRDVLQEFLTYIESTFKEGLKAPTNFKCCIGELGYLPRKVILSNFHEAMSYQSTLKESSKATTDLGSCVSELGYLPRKAIHSSFQEAMSYRSVFKESSKASTDLGSCASELGYLPRKVILSSFHEAKSYLSTYKQLSHALDSAKSISAESISILGLILDNLIIESLEGIIASGEQGLEVCKEGVHRTSEGIEVSIRLIVGLIKESFSYIPPGLYQLELASTHAVIALLELTSRRTLQMLIYELFSYHYPLFKQTKELSKAIVENAALLTFILQKISVTLLKELLVYGESLAKQGKQTDQMLSGINKEISDLALELYNCSIKAGKKETLSYVEAGLHTSLQLLKESKTVASPGIHVGSRLLFEVSKEGSSMISSTAREAFKDLKSAGHLSLEAGYQLSSVCADVVKDGTSYGESSVKQAIKSAAMGFQSSLEIVNMASHEAQFLTLEVISCLTSLNSEAVKLFKQSIKASSEVIIIPKEVVLACAQEITDSLNSYDRELLKFGTDEVPKHLAPIRKVTVWQTNMILSELITYLRASRNESRAFAHMLMDDNGETMVRVLYNPFLLWWYQTNYDVTKWSEAMKKNIEVRIEDFQKWIGKKG